MSDKNITATARVLKGVGGLFTVLCEPGDKLTEGRKLTVRARGSLRSGGKLLIGDRVKIELDGGLLSKDGTGFDVSDDKSGVSGAAITDILERKNTFIRPPMANLDMLFIVVSSARPDPSTPVTDKLISVCEYYSVEPVIVIGKSELDPVVADEMKLIYTSAGYNTFVLSCAEGTGICEFREYLKRSACGMLSAFAGASGAGKTTLMNSIFPDLRLISGEVSRKNGRGKNTTRAVEIFDVSIDGFPVLIADTPGFTSIDFENFDFLPFEALPDTMREFRDYYADCRWPDCSHTKEKDCGIAIAVREGKIAQSRHENYISMYEILKNKNRWDS